MKKLLFTAVLFMYAVAGFSQSDFQQGYFISNDGRKTECLIQINDRKNSPTEFEYKQSEDVPAQKQSLENVKEFSVLNDYKFKRFTVQIDNSSNRIHDMTKDKYPVWVTKTLFLNVLAEGKLNLYLYEDAANIKKFFISKGDHENAEQLVRKEYLADDKVGINSQYRQQLYNETKQEGAKMSDFERLGYTEKELRKVITDYNEKNNASVKTYEKLENKSIISAKPTVGIAMGSLNADSSSPIYDYKGNGLTFRLGLEFEYTFPSDKKNWAMFFDPNFSFFNDKGSNSNYDIEVKYRAIQFPVGIRHYIDVNAASRLFLNVGYAYNLALTSEIIYENEAANISSEGVEFENNSNIFLGIGYANTKYTLELRYNVNTPLAESTGGSVKYSSLGIVLGYKF